MDIIATGGIIGIATLLGGALVSQDVAGWIVGLAVGLTSVIPGRPALVVATALGPAHGITARMRPLRQDDPMRDVRGGQ